MIHVHLPFSLGDMIIALSSVIKTFSPDKLLFFSENKYHGFLDKNYDEAEN